MKVVHKRTAETEATYYVKSFYPDPHLRLGFATALPRNFQLIDRKIFPGKSASIARQGWVKGSVGFGLYALISTTGHPVAVEVGGRKYLLAAGQYMMPHFLDSWVVSSVTQDHEARRRIVYFSGSYLTELLDAMGMAPFREPVRFDETPRPMEPMLLNLVQMLFTVAPRRPLRDQAVEETLSILSYYLLHHHPHSQSGAIRGLAVTSAMEWQDPRIQRALEYLRAHLSQEVSLDQLAKAAGWNKYDLGTAMKRATGMTPIQLLQVYRIEAAKQLIKDDPSMSEGETARAVGYQDPKHFRDIFRRVAGLLPGEYSESLRGTPSRRVRKDR